MNRSPDQGLKAWQWIVHLPEFEIDVHASALVVIDLTYQQASPEYGICKRAIDAGYRDDLEYYLPRIEEVVVPSVQRLTDAFRRHSAPVFHTRCVSLRGDGSDQTWRHRSFGLACALGEKDAEFLEEIAPQPGDIVLNKTGSSVFNSTNFEHLLRNLGVSTIVVAGIFTNSCVEGTIRDAGDRDFRVLMAEDACAAMSQVGHENAIQYLDKNFCHVKPTEEIVAELEASASRSSELLVT
jgi:nicotinamidase-related amidase